MESNNDIICKICEKKCRKDTTLERHISKCINNPA